MGDTMIPGGAGSVREKSTGAERRTYERVGTVGGTFQGFRISSEAARGRYSLLEPIQKFYLAADDPTGRKTLMDLAAILLERQAECFEVEGSLYVDFTDACTWIHVGYVFLIQHREDPFSFLILGNTDRGLIVSTQGAWLNKADEIDKLAATWALANMLQQPMRRPEFPGNRGG